MKPMCEECGEEEATCAICSDIVKHYPLKNNGKVNWDEGEIVANDSDATLMCDDCAAEYC